MCALYLYLTQTQTNTHTYNIYIYISTYEFETNAILRDSLTNCPQSPAVERTGRARTSIWCRHSERSPSSAVVGLPSFNRANITQNCGLFTHHAVADGGETPLPSAHTLRILFQCFLVFGHSNTFRTTHIVHYRSIRTQFIRIFWL